MPLTLRPYSVNKGDWEQQVADFWKSYDYWDLYYLSTLDKMFQQNRKHYQIYSLNHLYVFNGPFASIMEKVSDKLNNKYFKVLSFSKYTRPIDLNTIIPILEK
jgi:hypothetical protein